MCVDYRSLNNSYVHDLFLAPFSDEIFHNVSRNKDYSFTDGFSCYHHVRIAEEDKKKTTFTTEWCSYAYNVMPSILINAPYIFSQIVIVAF